MDAQSTQDSHATATQSGTDSEATVRRFIEEVWQKGNSDAIDELIDPGYVQHYRGAPPGRDGVKQFFGMLRQAFPDLSYSLEDILADRDKVAWRWKLTATHLGTFAGIPATGSPVTVSGINIVRVAGGRIVENWAEVDMMGLMQQIGKKE